MQTKSVYLTLPVLNVEKTRAFWTTLGFRVNEKHSNDKAICIAIGKEIYVMMVEEQMYQTFTHRPISDRSTTQVILALELETQAQAEATIQQALALGATPYKELTEYHKQQKSGEYGWYYDSFVDLDGHQWEIIYNENSQPSN